MLVVLVALMITTRHFDMCQEFLTLWKPPFNQGLPGLANICKNWVNVYVRVGSATSITIAAIEI